MILYLIMLKIFNVYGQKLEHIFKASMEIIYLILRQVL